MCSSRPLPRIWCLFIRYSVNRTSSYSHYCWRFSKAVDQSFWSQPILKFLLQQARPGRCLKIVLSHLSDLVADSETFWLLELYIGVDFSTQKRSDKVNLIKFHVLYYHQCQQVFQRNVKHSRHEDLWPRSTSVWRGTCACPSSLHLTALYA